MKNKIAGLALISFLASVAGIIISFMLLKEDVTSTAHTLFEYFPFRYGVIPSATWTGAIILGLFTSVLQVVTASIMFSKNFSKSNRFLAFVMFVASCAFDNWTDVVFRSGNLTGDVGVATVTTLAFYTVGSEVLQGFSWLIFLAMWRQGISDLMWGMARFQAGFSSIGSEWNNFKKAASRKETRETNERSGGEEPKDTSPRQSSYLSPEFRQQQGQKQSSMFSTKREPNFERKNMTAAHFLNLPRKK